MYEKMLVPVDGSGTSLNGLDEAINLARLLQHSTIKVVHVMNEFVGDYTLAPSVSSERLIESLRESGMKALSDARTHAQRMGLDVDTEMIESIGARASDVIVETAKRWNADLIVMGTHGRRGAQGRPLGSDAEMVVRSSPVPVLTVRAAPKL